MQENRPLAPGGHPRPRDGQDEDGDPLITSRAVELREFNDDARCVPCLRLGRICHVKEGADSCLQCSATSSAHECVFIRKVVRQERMNWFTWPELTGFNNNPYRNARDHIRHPQHHREGHVNHYQDRPPPGPMHYAPYHQPPPNHPGENHVERTWNSYPPQGPHQGPPVYNGPMPPPKRQRTEMYDGQDVFAHSRQPSLQGGPPPDWQSPRRPEYHLPEIRPHEGPPVRRPDEQNHVSSDRPVSAPHERNSKALDLKPPSVPPSALKRKLEPEPSDAMNLPHRCSKCEASFKTPAELKKHFARHEPQYFCNIPGCSRGRDGFTTKNDLDRHRKTMHKILSPNDRFWKCFFPDCAKTEKVWPRLDNFKAHIVRMHGAQYVQENVTRAEEWWDSQKTPIVGRSPETTHDLVAIEPKPQHEPSRLGVNNLLAEPPEHINGRRRHLSAEGRQEAAQVREMGACLRCALLKEKCDDNRVCHRCNSYANKHFNGTLICRRGNIADYLVPLIPLFSNLPQPIETTKGWNLRSFSPKLRISTFSELLEATDYPRELHPFEVHSNSFTTTLFGAMDEVISAHGRDSTKYGPEFLVELEVLRQLREVCCLIYDCVGDTLKQKPTDQEKADLIEKLQKTNLELREWYDELDNAVFDWKSRHLELNHHPMKKWNLFFSICAMLIMERLTVLLTRSWAYVTEVKEESSDDEAADTLCALLEFKFQRQAPAQHHFISMLLDDRSELQARSPHPIAQLAALTCTPDLRKTMGFLRETKGFETWKWLYEQFGDAGADPDESPKDQKTEDGEDSDTIQVDQTDTIDRSRRSSEGYNIRSRRSASRNHVGGELSSQNGHDQDGDEAEAKKEDSSSPDKMSE
ncbi:hypothetical protein LTR70_008969 [Exophiala xenobiotica]|uniref:C2H2-type domain-containing protein n=1 Tax=Lithohypha guttulata TaxID=1690604 RepID=A0ABR0JZX4_9EURO|nr:hypothetical protein LTR24_008705 [Lithohypha guttulata]KAK5311167.1 hypothetical protein LTR70_008969 [Exophiala xenobiotica]